jgi:hypothetical protein
VATRGGSTFSIPPTTLARGVGEPWVGADGGAGDSEGKSVGGMGRKRISFGLLGFSRGRKDFGLETRLEHCILRLSGVHYRPGR